MKLKPINKQVVVVFGASSGIGRLTALQFAERGAKLVIAARGERGLQTLAHEIRRKGGQAEYVVADASEFEQVKRIAEQAIESYGRLDTWVQTAGVGMWARFEQTTPEEWRRIIDVNLSGQAYGAMAALPALRRSINEHGGCSLIHVSSGESVLSPPLQSAYAASKHGMRGLLEALRSELKHEGVSISVTEVMPSGINTPIFNNARTKLGVKPKPLPPLYQPQVVANAILYAAEHPIPEIVAGGAAKAGMIAQQLSPRLLNAFLSGVGFTMQRSDEPKSERAPDNLFHPLENETRIKGDFDAQARRGSFYTWSKTHPAAGASIAGAVLGGALMILAGRASTGDKESKKRAAALKTS